MVIYILILLLIATIVYIYLHKQELNRIIIIPRGKMYSITTYSNGIVTDMKLVSSRYIKQWFDAYKYDKKLNDEGVEFDLESGKLINKKPGRPKNNKRRNNG